MDELVTTVTKFKAKQGCENHLIEALRNFDKIPVQNLGRYLA